MGNLRVLVMRDVCVKAYQDDEVVVNRDFFIKELLLNFLRSEDDYVEVSRLIKLFNTLG